MAKWIVIILLIILSAQQVRAGTPPPPVEVHITDADLLYMYDCYPLNTQDDTPDLMIVYITFHDGIAGYGCTYSGGARIKPIAPQGKTVLAHWASD